MKIIPAMTVDRLRKTVSHLRRAASVVIDAISSTASVMARPSFVVSALWVLGLSMACWGVHDLFGPGASKIASGASCLITSVVVFMGVKRNG